MMERMSLLSSVFISRKDLSKEVTKMEKGEEEGPCTSYSQREGDMKHEEDLKHEEHLEPKFLS